MTKRRRFAEYRARRIAELQRDPTLPPLNRPPAKWARAQRLREQMAPAGTESRVADTTEGLCAKCGYSHALRSRLRLIRRQALTDYPLPVRKRLIQELWPCFYPEGEIGEQQVERDIRDVEEIG